MSDGQIHGVHVWSGPATDDPPERPIPGPLKWNMTLGVATDTPESLANTGRNLEIEDPAGRPFAQSWPSGDLKPNEGKALAAAVRSEAGHTLCDTWDSTDWQGNHIRVSFVARNRLEPGPDGRDYVIARGMNWRAEPADRAQSADRLAQQILHGLAQPGVHRALFDPYNWTVLKWLDEPCPFYDWRRISADAPRMHPSDEATMAAMTAEFAAGATSRVLRMPGQRRRVGAGPCDRQPGGNRPGHVSPGWSRCGCRPPLSWLKPACPSLTRPGRRGRLPAQCPIGRLPGPPRPSRRHPGRRQRSRKDLPASPGPPRRPVRRLTRRRRALAPRQPTRPDRPRPEPGAAPPPPHPGRRSHR